MNKDVRITVSKGRFKKIREWNRRKNYYLKEVKLEARMSIAKLLWDKRKKVSFEPDSVKTICLFAMKEKWVISSFRCHSSGHFIRLAMQ